MLAHRVIPTLLMRGDKLVKGTRFDAWRSVGVVAQAMRVHQQRGCDELILLDIAATPEGRGPDFAAIERLTRDCFVPLTVGGGVRSVEDVRGLLNAGADKVAICTALGTGTALLRECAEAVGCQAIVASIDYRELTRPGLGLRPCVAVGCGQNNVIAALDDGGVPMHPIEWAQSCERAGAGEILLTSIDREGTLEGYDLDLIRSVSEAVNIPVVAHGGCGTYAHMVEAIQAGASAVAAGAMFQFTDATPRGAAQYLKAAGVEARV